MDAALIDMVLRQVASVHSKALESLGIKTQTWITEARSRLRQVWDRSGDRHMEALQLGSTAEAPPRTSKPLGPSHHASIPLMIRSAGTHNPEPYSVPESFTGEDLPLVDLSNRKKAQATVPLAFLQRWLHLRSEIPESEREAYNKGQHLRGRDADLCERCRAELMKVHGKQLKELRLDDSKWLLREAKVLIRTNVIRTRQAFHEADCNNDDENLREKSPPIQAGQKRKRKTILSKEALEEGGAIAASNTQAVRGASVDSSSGSEFRGGKPATSSSGTTGGSVVASEDGDGDDDSSSSASSGSEGPTSNRPNRPRSEQPPRQTVTGDHDKALLRLQMRMNTVGSQKRRKRKAPGKRPAAAADHEGDPSMPSQKPQSPILPDTMAATCTTWSHVMQGDEGSNYVILAVGTVGGVLWLWRMKLPRSYSPRPEEHNPRFQLVGMHSVSATSSITTLAYAQQPLVRSKAGSASASRAGPAAPVQPLLAIGCSDGSVHLVSHEMPGMVQSPHESVHATSASHGSAHDSGEPRDAAPSHRNVEDSAAPAQSPVAAAGAAEATVVHLGTVIPADRLCVTCCQLLWRVPQERLSTGTWEAQLVVGKTMGVVVRCVCQIDTAGQLQLSGKPTVHQRHLHGSATVTAISAAAERIVSAADSTPVVLQAPAFARKNNEGTTANREGSYNRDYGACIELPPTQILPRASVTGLALSPGAIFAAVVFASSTAAQKRMSNAERIKAGCVELIYLPALEQPSEHQQQHTRNSVVSRSPWWQGAADVTAATDVSKSAAALWECATALGGCPTQPQLPEMSQRQEEIYAVSHIAGAHETIGTNLQTHPADCKDTSVELHLVPPRSSDTAPCSADDGLHPGPANDDGSHPGPASAFGDLAPRLKSEANVEADRLRKQREAAVRNFLATHSGQGLSRASDASSEGPTTSVSRPQLPACILRGTAALRSRVLGVQWATGGGLVMGQEAATVLLSHLKELRLHPSPQPTATEVNSEELPDLVRIVSWLAVQSSRPGVGHPEVMTVHMEGNVDGVGNHDSSAACELQSEHKDRVVQEVRINHATNKDVALPHNALEDPLIQGNRWRVPLCPASLAPISNHERAWECGVCLRLYSPSETPAGTIGGPNCVMCGVRLRQYIMHSFLTDVRI